MSAYTTYLALLPYISTLITPYIGGVYNQNKGRNIKHYISPYIPIYIGTIVPLFRPLFQITFKSYYSLTPFSGLTQILQTVPFRLLR